MDSRENKTAPGLLVAIVALTAAIFAADVALPLGIAVWILYFAPVALSKFAWRPHTPLLTATACSVLIVAGFFLSPGRGSEAATYSPLNRAFGIVTIWAAAVTGWRFVITRCAIQREAW